MRKVSPGERIRYPASTHNAFIDAAEDYQSRLHDLIAGKVPTLRQTGIIRIVNETGEPRDRFDILAIDGPIVTPSDDLDEFVGEVVLRGVIPTDDYIGRFVVLLDAIDDGDVGRAVIDGVCHVRVEMRSEADEYADVLDGTAETLKSDSSGTAQLLWIQREADRESPDVAWAVARIGLPPGSSDIHCIVLGLTREPGSGSVMATCSRILARPMVYDTDPPLQDKFVGWAGIDPLIMDGSHVLVRRCAPLRDDPTNEVQYSVVAVFTGDPATMVWPNQEDYLVWFSEECS